MGLLVLLLFSSTFTFSQNNLVPNPSFENYTSCPTDQDQLSKAFPWFIPTLGSTDYFNSCNFAPYPSNYDVPLNYCGYQDARTGNAYAGVGSELKDTNFDNHEYMAVKLLQPLKKGYRYSVEFYLSLAEYSTSATDAMGAYLSKDSLIDYSNYDLLIATPQIKNPKGNVLKDTVNWVNISAIYLSEGGEQFLTIGNFVTNSENTTDTFKSCTFCLAYYYIDDVSVICLDCDSDTTVTTVANNLFIPDAFSPNGDGNNDKLFVRGNNIQELYFAVYDRWGEKVFETTDKNIGWDGTYKSGTLSGAVFVYYCKGKYTDGVEFKQKGDVTLVR